MNNSSMAIKLVWPCEMLKSVLGIAETTLKYRTVDSKFTHSMELWTHDKGGNRCCVKNNVKTDPMHTQEQGGIDDEHHTPDKGHRMLINCCPSFSLKPANPIKMWTLESIEGKAKKVKDCRNLEWAEKYQRKRYILEGLQMPSVTVFIGNKLWD